MYPSLLSYTSAADANKLEDEFLQYQLTTKAEVPKDVWEYALVVDRKIHHYRIDIIWAYMITMKTLMVYTHLKGCLLSHF